jgi:hypothetical protein
MKKPRPFQRERVAMDRHGRTWQHIPASQIQPEDTIAGLGKVTRIATDASDAVGDDFYVLISTPQGTSRHHRTDNILAFAPANA